MTYDNPTLEDVISFFHKKALKNNPEGRLYTEKLKGLVEDMSTRQYVLHPYYNGETQIFDYSITILGGEK